MQHAFGFRFFVRQLVTMNWFLYYVIILPFSVMPMFVLHGWSSFAYLLLYHVFGYRKKVVMTNLRNSFPEKSEQELKRIARKFYRHLCDLMVESVKYFTISEKQIKKRMKCRNPELVERYFDQGRSVVLVGGHYNSWELYALECPFHLKHNTSALYTPLKNPFWNEKMKGSRSRTGMKMVSGRKIREWLEDPDPKPKATIFAADQAPGSSRNCHWMEFLNQDTAVAFGTEKYAREFNSVIIYGHNRKVKRSHYEVEYVVLDEQPQEAAQGELTEKHVKMLEGDILDKPEHWLWSHRRWKRKRPKENE